MFNGSGNVYILFTWNTWYASAMRKVAERKERPKRGNTESTPIPPVTRRSIKIYGTIQQIA